MQINPLPVSPSRNQRPVTKETLTLNQPFTDPTLRLSDELLLHIFSYFPISSRNSISLVCNRWFFLLGRLQRSVKLLDWSFLESGRLVHRFCNLIEIDLVSACFNSKKTSEILLTHKNLSIYLDSHHSGIWILGEDHILPSELIDLGLKIVARNCPNLQRLAVAGATEAGLLNVATECAMMQELELHRCTDLSLRSIYSCRNLQILKIVGSLDGLYNTGISDIGLTILANGCKRLVKLELVGCEGSYDGISAIGKCCVMLEELSISSHRMDAGWIAALKFCENLKTLKVHDSRRIDENPGPIEYLGCCPTLERLQIQRCQLRDKESVCALFLICGAIKELIIQDCWGFDDEVFSIAKVFRKIKLLSLEGCSLLRTDGLESVVLSWKELQSLRVVSCNNVKDDEVSPALSSLFSVLKELTWRPDSKSVLQLSLNGTGMGRKGGRFFKSVLAQSV